MSAAMTNAIEAVDAGDSALTRGVGVSMERGVGMSMDRGVGPLGAFRIVRRAARLALAPGVNRGAMVARARRVVPATARRISPARARALYRASLRRAQLRGFSGEFEGGIEDPGMGSWFSKAFKKVTGTKLSDAVPGIIGAASSLIPGVGPVVGAVVGAAASAIKTQGVPGYAGGMVAASQQAPAFPAGGATGPGMGPSPAERSAAMYSGKQSDAAAQRLDDRDHGRTQSRSADSDGGMGGALPLLLLGGALLLGGRR